jgi:hypothetical protein
MNQEESHPATRISQERNIQKAFISIDTSSLLSTNLQLAQWPIGYKFNMIPTFDGESYPRQFLMSFEAAVIAGEGGRNHTCKVTCHGSKRSNTTLVFISESKIHTFMGTIKDKSTS